MKIVIIGTGNVATVLGRSILQAGHDIVQVFGRNIDAAIILARELNSKPNNSWKQLNNAADLILAAIADEALYELERYMPGTRQVVAHTAGSVSKDVLKTISENHGVLYPLQSLRKEQPVITSIPMLINASNESTFDVLLELANSFSGQVSTAGDEERLKLHVAAVCANNFVTHLYAVAADYCQLEHLDFNMLLPLIRETAARIEHVPPRELMTGPAVRNDYVTIERHLELLSPHPLFKKLYSQLTESIVESGRRDHGNGS